MSNDTLVLISIHLLQLDSDRRNAEPILRLRWSRVKGWKEVVVRFAYRQIHSIKNR